VDVIENMAWIGGDMKVEVASQRMGEVRASFTVGADLLEQPLREAIAVREGETAASLGHQPARGFARRPW
jgi:hypothetical protein